MKEYKKDKTDGRNQTRREQVIALLRTLAGPLAVALLLCVAVYGLSGAIRGRAESKLLPIYCVDRSADTGTPKVSLTFDGAWGNEDTSRILEILAKNNVKVTFFLTGGWMEKYPDDVKNIAAAGHDIGNHSENHKQMSKLSAEECKQELAKPHEKIKELTGIEMNLFRPPYGDYNNTLVSAVQESGYYCVQWDVDSLDWKDYGVDAIVKRVTEHKHLGNGSIILMHNGAKYTADALESVILGLKAKGYELVPLSQLIPDGEYEMNHEGKMILKK